MIKRILKVIVWTLCLPLLFIVALCMPLLVIYALAKYVITGVEDMDIFFAPIGWVINLPDNITEK